MKTRMLLLALLMGTATTIFAQTSTVEERVEYSSDKYKVETNGFWDNWFISLGAGPQVFFGDHDNRAPFGDRIAPAVDLAVGKWFTPVVGFRAMYSGLQVKGATKWENSGWSNSYGTGEPIADPAHGLQGQKFYMGNVHVDALFNLNNLFAGYNPKRVWHCSVYAGMGWAWVYDKKADALGIYQCRDTHNSRKYQRHHYAHRSKLTQTFEGLLNIPRHQFNLSHNKIHH